MSLAIDTERRYLGGDISDEPPKLLNGAFPLLDGPGLGVSVDQAAINRFALDAISGAYLDEDRPDWFPTKPMY